MTDEATAQTDYVLPVGPLEAECLRLAARVASQAAKLEEFATALAAATALLERVRVGGLSRDLTSNARLGLDVLEWLALRAPAQPAAPEPGADRTLAGARPGPLTNSTGYRLAAIKAKLDAVRKLPEQWRSHYPKNTELGYGAAGIRWCADELEAALLAPGGGTGEKT